MECKLSGLPNFHLQWDVKAAAATSSHLQQRLQTVWITKCIPLAAAHLPALSLTSHGLGYPIRARFISLNANFFWGGAGEKSVRNQVLFIDTIFLSQSRQGTVKF